MKGQLGLFRAEPSSKLSAVWVRLPEQVRAELVAQLVRVVVESVTNPSTLRPSRRPEEKR